jgi:hypothetical protein
MVSGSGDLGKERVVNVSGGLFGKEVKVVEGAYLWLFCPALGR